MDHTSDSIFFVDSSTLGDSRVRVGPGLEHLLSTWDLTMFFGREGFILNICPYLSENASIEAFPTNEIYYRIATTSTTRWTTTLLSTCLHAINLRVLCGANVVASHPEIEGNGSCVVHLVMVQLFHSFRCEKGFNYYVFPNHTKSNVA